MKAQTFEAALEKGDRSLGWTIARVPFVPSKVWPDMLRLRVRGNVNGFAFRTSLFADGVRGGFYVLINRAMQEGANVRLAQTATFRLEPDLEPRPAELPDALAVLLDEEHGLRSFYDSLSESMRRELGKWICSVKSEASQQKRSEQAAERLLATMEAEQELPPVIAAAFRQRPKAKLGWMKMTETQKRSELMGVFYYQTPAAREKRVARLCDAAEKKTG